MNIRPAERRDVPDLVRMGWDFYATTSYAKHAEFDTNSVGVMIDMMLDSGVLLVAEHASEVIGMVGLIVTPFLFNHGHKSAHEVMWWVDPDARNTGAGLALLSAVTPACKKAGAILVQMIHLSNSPAHTSMLYERMGYDHTESSYTKALI